MDKNDGLEAIKEIGRRNIAAMVIRNYAHHLTSVYNQHYIKCIQLEESTGQMHHLPVSPPDANKVTVKCPRCQDSVIAIRFRTHLMKCAGDGRKSNKEAQKKISEQNAEMAMVTTDKVPKKRKRKNLKKKNTVVNPEAQ
uniref:SAGA-associated factor 11 n=1 Tax=Panagrolaimus sp. JU765 TaxID=591449 RepID=A0AC34PUB1_9BILA